MRNEFVVLVALCVGVASGFILPLGDAELDLVRESNNENKDEKSHTNLTLVEAVRSDELPNNRSEVDESALYEHAVEKQNNQSERAFIYINQRYKKPSLHQYFRIAQNGPEFSRSFHLPPPLPQATIQRLNEPCKSEPGHINSFFQGYDFPDRSPDITSYFAPPRLSNYNVNDILNNYKGTYNDNERSYNQNRLETDQRDYIELLKSPLLRPLIKSNATAKYDGIPGPHLTSFNFKDILKLPQISESHNAQANILVDERIKEMRKSYGFNPSYARHPAYGLKGMIQRVDDSFEGGFINSDDDSSRLDKSQSEDKLLDQYLRDALADQVTSNEKAIIPSDCSYRDCILQSAKHSSSIMPHKDNRKPECKCGRRLRLKQNDVFSPKDRQEREEKHFNDTNNIVATDDTTYVNYLEENASKNLTDQKDLSLLLINKLNSTLHH